MSDKTERTNKTDLSEKEITEHLIKRQETHKEKIDKISKKEDGKTMPLKIIQKGTNGKTIHGTKMPAPIMNIIIGAFACSWLILHAMSILIVESWIKSTETIVFKTSFTYISIVLLITFVGWVLSKLDLIGNVEGEQDE